MIECPLVSIGLPVVKSNYLLKSIECCLSQTYSNTEIIILNNAKDSQGKLEIRNLVNCFSDNRIQYFENDKQFPMVKNWNSTLDKAKGEFFALLCDDDFWEPNFIEEMISLSKTYSQTSIFHSRLAKVSDEGEVLAISDTCPSFESALDFIYHRLNGSRETYLSDFMVRTNALKVKGGFIDLPDGWGSDTITWFYIALNSGGVAYSDKILFNYRISDMNTTNSINYKNKLLAIQKQYFLLQDIFVSINFSNNKYEKILKELFEKQIARYIQISKRHIFYNLLIVNYKLPKSLSYLLSLFYRYYLSKRK